MFCNIDALSAILCLCTIVGATSRNHHNTSPLIQFQLAQLCEKNSKMSICKCKVTNTVVEPRGVAASLTFGEHGSTVGPISAEEPPKKHNIV